MDKVIRETCIAGAVIDRTVKASFPHGGARRPKSKPTSEAVRKNNDRIAAKKLTRLINANFMPGDLHVTLTYAEVVNVEKANHELDLWLRRMRREYSSETLHGLHSGKNSLWSRDRAANIYQPVDQGH